MVKQVSDTSIKNNCFGVCFKEKVYMFIIRLYKFKILFLNILLFLELLSTLWYTKLNTNSHTAVINTYPYVVDFLLVFQVCVHNRPREIGAPSCVHGLRPQSSLRTPCDTETSTLFYYWIPHNHTKQDCLIIDEYSSVLEVPKSLPLTGGSCSVAE